MPILKNHLLLGFLFFLLLADLSLKLGQHLFHIPLIVLQHVSCCLRIYHVKLRSHLQYLIVLLFYLLSALFLGFHGLELLHLELLAVFLTDAFLFTLFGLFFSDTHLVLHSEQSFSPFFAFLFSLELARLDLFFVVIDEFILFVKCNRKFIWFLVELQTC